MYTSCDILTHMPYSNQHKESQSLVPQYIRLLDNLAVPKLALSWYPYILAIVYYCHEK